MRPYPATSPWTLTKSSPPASSSSVSRGTPRSISDALSRATCSTDTAAPRSPSP